MEKMPGIDRGAALPSYHGRTFVMRSKHSVPPVDYPAPAVGRKAVLYATCFINYNNPQIGEATRAALARNGVETEVLYPQACGMPQLEQGNLAAVARSASEVAAVLGPRIDEGYDVVALVPSCALMLKFEWPLIAPGNSVEKLSKAMFDISEYIVDIARKEGLAPELSPLEGGVTVHLACHARWQSAKICPNTRCIRSNSLLALTRSQHRGLKEKRGPHGRHSIATLPVPVDALGHPASRRIHHCAA